MSVTVGTVTAQLVNVDRVFDSERGWSFVLTYEGEQTSIETQAGIYETVANYPGVKTTTTHRGPLYTLTVTLPEYSGEGGDYTDRYDVVAEYVNESIWDSPKILEYGIGNYDATGDDLAKFLAGMRTACEGLVRDKDDPEAVDEYAPDWFISEFASWIASVNYSPWIDICNMMYRGAESHEVQRTVLRRTRTIPIGSMSQVILNASEPIFTTTALINQFGLPPDVAWKIESISSQLPAAHAKTAWSWKIRQDESRIVLGTGKCEETRDWVFAQWSTILYTLVTT